MTAKLRPRPVPTGAGQQHAPEVRELRTIAEFEEAVRVLCQVWNADTALDLVNSSTMVALDMSDNYVAGVFLGKEMVGAAVGWRGAGNHLHSHIAGILPNHQGEGLGYLLKQHEREWARSHKLSVVQWTFDPLVRRNAHFNLSKLNARVLGYRADLYGSLKDGVNDNDHTDRLLVEWNLKAGTRPVREQYGSDLVGPVSLEPEKWDFEAAPDATVASADGSVRLVLTPHDIESVRFGETDLARRWRQAVRQGLRTALDDGFEITGFTADGCYVLRRRRGVLPRWRTPTRR